MKFSHIRVLARIRKWLVRPLISSPVDVRVAQSISVVRQIPMGVLGNSVGAIVAGFTISRYISWLAVLPMVIGIPMLLFPVARSWLRLRRRQVPKHVSTRRINRVIMYSGILGTAWAACILLYLPMVPFSLAAVLMATSGFMVCGAMASLYPIPLAALCYGVPMLAANIRVAASSDSRLSLSILCIMILMGMSMLWMLYANWRTFVSTVSLARDRAAALATAKAAGLAKSRFLENVSHEIRTPLSSIVGFSNLLKEYTALPDREKEFVRNISLAGEALLVLLNDLLDVSKLVAGQMTLDVRPMHVAQPVTEAVALVDRTAQAKGLALIVHFAPSVPKHVMGDADRMRQIVLNLVSNAVKFTEGGRIEVRVDWRVSSEEEGVLGLEVSDSGIGIDQKHLQSIFQRFSKVDSLTTRRYSGVGLGLSICRDLVGLMRGKIDADSELGKGTTIRVTVPMKIATVDSVSNRATLANPILVVDDDRLSRQLMVNMLVSQETRIIEASNGKEAIELCAMQKFSIIFMDIQMAGMDGLAATRLIKESSALNRSTPVVAVTGYISHDQTEEFTRAGIMEHVPKPVRQERLVHVLLKSTKVSDVPGA